MAPLDDASDRDSIALILNNAQRVLRGSSPYLEPEESPFSSPRMAGLRAYEVKVATSLLGAAECETESLAVSWQREETASLVCLPAFAPEWALWLVGARKAGFWVLLIEADKNIWYSTRNDSGMLHSPSVTKRHNKLPMELGTAICDIWSRVLSQTRYSKESQIAACDGIEYHFAYSRRSIGSMAGKAWSPGETTAPGKLVALSNNLREYVQDGEHPNLQIVRRIEDQIAGLKIAD
jgi:hypothetical protein